MIYPDPDIRILKKFKNNKTRTKRGMIYQRKEIIFRWVNLLHNSEINSMERSICSAITGNESDDERSVK